MLAIEYCNTESEMPLIAVQKPEMPQEREQFAYTLYMYQSLKKT